MKPYFYLLFIIAFCSHSCNDKSSAIKKPNACFEIAPNNTLTSDSIKFTNCSSDAITYTWVLNDSIISHDSELEHTFFYKGNYALTLIATNEYSSDSVTKRFEVLDKYQNYLKLSENIYPVNQAYILNGKFGTYQKHKIFIYNNKVKISGDSLLGDGQGICLVINEKLTPKEYILTNESYCLGYDINLEGALLNVKSSTDSLEIEIKQHDVSLYYKANFKVDKLSTFPTVDILKQYINKQFKNSITHKYFQYEQLLSELSKDKYITLPIKEMIETYNETKVIVGMRHDVDNQPFSAIEMAKLEQKYNIRSSYYILATSLYYGFFNNGEVTRYRCMESVYQYLYSLNNEIGIHNDLIAVMILHGINPFLFNKNEFAFYKSLNIPIVGSVAHGSTIARQTAHNSQIFSDFATSSFVEYNGENYPIGEHSMKEFGFEYEANFIDMNRYYSDGGGVWNIDGGFDQLLIALKKSKPGDRIQILTHPCWWGN